MRKRNNPIYIRLSDDEYNHIMNMIHTSGQTIQSYIINCLMKGKVSSQDEVMELRKQSNILADMDKQLKGIGVNINQLAHIANASGIPPSSEELENMSENIMDIRKEVNGKWQSIRQSISEQHLTQP